MGVTQVAPIGALKSWLERGNMAKLAPYIDPEVKRKGVEFHSDLIMMQDLAVWHNTISREGIRAALCWHKVLYLRQF